MKPKKWERSAPKQENQPKRETYMAKMDPSKTQIPNKITQDKKSTD